MIQSLDCNETLVARLVSEGGRGVGGVATFKYWGDVLERGEIRGNFAKMLDVLQLKRGLSEEATKNGAGVGNARTGQ